MSPCSSCGAPLSRSNARFCARCGASLTDRSAAAPASPTQLPGLSQSPAPRTQAAGTVVTVILIAALALGGIVYAATRGDDNTSNLTTDEIGVDDGYYDDSDDYSDNDPYTYGDDSELDLLWDDCADGDFNACTALHRQSPGGSRYEPGGSRYQEFGATCGDRYSAWICSR